MIDVRYPLTMQRPPMPYRHFQHTLFRLLDTAGIDRATPRLPYAARNTASSPEDPSNSAPFTPSVGVIVDFIEAHPDEALSLDHLSNRAYLSKYHFARVFRDEVGMPPWTYVRTTRLRKARELLDQEPDLSLTEIALRTGFYDQSHFTKAFKKNEGITPGQYRKQKRKNVQDPPGSDR